MQHPKIKAGDVLGEALKACGREKEVMVLLAALVSVVFLLLLWPILDSYSLLMVGQGDPQEVARLLFQDLYDNRWFLGVAFVVYLFVGYAVSMIWSRVSVLGRDSALAGGGEQFLKRVGWTFWRNLCAIGWIVLFFGVPVGIIFAIGQGQSAGGSMGATALWLVAVPLLIFALVAVFAVSTLLPIAVHGEARDFHLPIHRAFVLMRGNLARGAGLLVLVILLFEIGLGTVFAIFGPAALEAGGWIMLIGNFLLAAVGVLIQFAVGAYGAYYAVRVVPELKV